MPYREKSGIWRGKIQHNGRRYTRRFRTRREAIAWETATRKRLTGPTRTGTDLLTLCNRYMDFAERHYVKTTIQEKKTLCRRILAAWGNVPADEVLPDMVLQYLDEQATARSTNAYNKDRKNIMALFAHGVKFLGVTRNPVSMVPTIHHQRSAQYVPPVADVLKILSVAEREERVLLECYLNTGARRSEVLRWTWHDDINFTARKVRLGTRKTRDGSMEYEWIPMSDALYRELRWQWKNRKIKESPWVFVCTQPGRWYGKPYTTRRRFMPGLCKRAGVRPFGFHALRRFVASYLADTQKVSAKTIQRILRHKNLRTTERYIKNINNDLRDIYEKLTFENKTAHETAHTHSKSEP